MNLDKGSIKREYYPFIIFGIVFFIAQCFISIYPGDDTYFVETVSKSKSIIDFVAMRYQSWSGRIISEFIFFIKLMDLEGYNYTINSESSLLHIKVYKIVNSKR